MTFKIFAQRLLSIGGQTQSLADVFKASLSALIIPTRSHQHPRESGPWQVKSLFETERVKELILSKSAKEFGMNKNARWYQKKRLEESGSLEIYNKTKQHFV